MSIHKLILIYFAVLLTATAARAGEVISIQQWKARQPVCDAALTEPGTLVAAGFTQGRALFHGILGQLRAVDPVLVDIRTDLTGAIWDWTPRDEKTQLDIRFERDEHHRARRVFVTRRQGLPDLIVEDPRLIHTLEDVLRIHREEARVFIDLELDALFARAPLTEGLIL